MIERDIDIVEREGRIKIEIEIEKELREGMIKMEEARLLYYAYATHTCIYTYTLHTYTYHIYIWCMYVCVRERENDRKGNKGSREFYGRREKKKKKKKMEIGIDKERIIVFFFSTGRKEYFSTG